MMNWFVGIAAIFGTTDDDRTSTEWTSYVRMKPEANAVHMKEVFAEGKQVQLLLYLEFSKANAASEIVFIIKKKKNLLCSLTNSISNCRVK